MGQAGVLMSQPSGGPLSGTVAPPERDSTVEGSVYRVRVVHGLSMFAFGLNTDLANSRKVDGSIP